mgnify:CR=1 FL=1
MIIINLLDGEKINIHEDTILNGFINAPRTTDEIGGSMFYLQSPYTGSIDCSFELDPTPPHTGALTASDKRFAIGGFLLSHDMFSIGDELDATLYLTSAVKSISVV